MKKRVIPILLTIVLLTALFSVCACTPAGSTTTTQKGTTTTPSGSGTSQSTTTAAPLYPTYPLDGTVTLKYASAVSAHVTAVSTWPDTPFWQAWQEQTGVKLELQEVTDFSLLLASGDYPDIITSGAWGSYSGGIAKAIDDGIVMPITDYLDTLAVNYKERLMSNEEWMKGATTPDGQFPGFYHLRSNDPGVSNSYGMIMRKDWLDDLGLSAPVTADEFVNTLTAFKNDKSAASPFSIPIGELRNMGNWGILTSPYGLVSTGYFHTDGKVHYGAFEASYKDYLVWLNKLFADGLLDKNFLTLDTATKNSNIMNGISGATGGYAGGGIGVWMGTMKDKDPKYELVGVGSLVANAGDKALFSQRQALVPGQLSVVTTSCKNPEIAVQFLNYGYTEPGDLLMQFGVEGKSFEMRDGKPYYTDLVLKNPDGLPFAQALSQYDFCPENGPYIQGGEFCFQSYSDIQNSALAVWKDSDVMDHFIAPVTIDPKDAEEYSTITSEIFTYINENFALFVTGEKPISEFDAYIDTLKSMKIERMLELYQNAYDKYIG
ncbi:MAG: extracellular solute-binding protein [Clostridiales bacterium]|nr:extracellular solute-binding protein [Clostridiales bacterium]